MVLELKSNSNKIKTENLKEESMENKLFFNVIKQISQKFDISILDIKGYGPLTEKIINSFKLKPGNNNELSP